VFIITKAQEKVGTDLLGWHFTINIEKSRFVKEKSKFSFLVKYEGGVGRWSGLIDLATEAGMLVKTRKRSYVYNLINPETGEIGEEDYSEADTNTSKFWMPILTNDTFQKFIENKYCTGTGSLVGIDEEDVLEEIYKEEISE